MNEQNFAEFIANRAELYLTRTPESYEIDYALIERTSGDVVAWLEVICHSGSPDNEFLLDIKTWEDGIKLTEFSGKPFLIGYRWKEWDFLLQVQSGYIPLVLIMDHPSDDCTYVRIPKSLFFALTPG